MRGLGRIQTPMAYAPNTPREGPRSADGRGGTWASNVQKYQITSGSGPTPDLDRDLQKLMGWLMDIP